MANQTERLLHQAIADLEEMKKDLGRAVRAGVGAADPFDPVILSIDNQIDEQKKLIRRIRDMVEAGKEFESLEALRAASAARRDSVKLACKKAIQRIELAKKIDKQFATLGALFLDWDVLGKECASAAAAVNRDLSAGWQYQMLNAARGNDGRFAAALEHALHRYGIGTVGVTLDTMPRKPLGEFFTFEQAATLVAERLQAQLDNLADIADKEAAL